MLSQRGAVTGVLVLAMLLPVLGAMVVVDGIAVLTGGERATSAADAAAHAAMTVLDVQPDRDELSIRAQAGESHCEVDLSEHVDRSGDPGCAAGYAAAVAMAGANDARLLTYVVGPDTHRYAGRAGGVGFEVLVQVAMRVHIPLGRLPCPEEPTQALCWAIAAGAATDPR